MSAVPEITWDEFVKVCDDLHRVTADLAIAEDALEAERQWRLTSLPALLAAEERAVKAEAEVASFRNVTEYPKAFPELTRSQVKRHAALADAYHESKERP